MPPCIGTRVIRGSANCAGGTGAPSRRANKAIRLKDRFIARKNRERDYTVNRGIKIAANVAS